MLIRTCTFYFSFLRVDINAYFMWSCATFNLFIKKPDKIIIFFVFFNTFSALYGIDSYFPLSDCWDTSVQFVADHYLLERFFFPLFRLTFILVCIFFIEQ